MKTGDKVITPYGTGEILTQEFSKGSLSNRYLVKLDNCVDDIMEIHRQNGGVYFWGKEIEVVKV